MELVPLGEIACRSGPGFLLFGCKKRSRGVFWFVDVCDTHRRMSASVWSERDLWRVFWESFGALIPAALFVSGRTEEYFACGGVSGVFLAREGFVYYL